MFSIHMCRLVKVRVEVMIVYLELARRCLDRWMFGRWVPG